MSSSVGSRTKEENKIKIELNQFYIDAESSGGVAYYLLYYPNQQKKISQISYDSLYLSLPKDMYDKIFICAKMCNISQEELDSDNVKFCQIPQEILTLPTAAQKELYKFKPHYRLGVQSTATKNKLNNRLYKRIPLNVPLGREEDIKERAKQLGLSVNAYLNGLINEDLEKC